MVITQSWSVVILWLIEKANKMGKISISVHRCELSTSVATKTDELFIGEWRDLSKICIQMG